MTSGGGDSATPTVAQPPACAHLPSSLASGRNRMHRAARGTEAIDAYLRISSLGWSSTSAAGTTASRRDQWKMHHQQRGVEEAASHSNRSTGTSTGCSRTPASPSSRPELSALLRQPGHKHFRVCGDQMLRNFIKGLTLAAWLVALLHCGVLAFANGLSVQARFRDIACAAGAEGDCRARSGQWPYGRTGIGPIQFT